MTVAPENGTLRKKRGSSSGSVRRDSYAGSATSATRPSTKQPTISGEPQPVAGPSMMPNVTEASTTQHEQLADRVDPARSVGAGTPARTGAASTIAATPTGTLIQKIDRQPSPSTSAPPRTGPSAMLSPTTPPQTPIARARSRGSVNVFVMIDMATGLSMEPPTACTVRNAISQPSPGATLHSSEPTVNRASPAWKVRRRPTRSAVEPDRISRLASTSVYASSTHCSEDTEASRSVRSAGSAMFTIVTSSPTMNRLRQQIASTRSRRRWLSSGIGSFLPARSSDPGSRPAGVTHFIAAGRNRAYGAEEPCGAAARRTSPPVRTPGARRSTGGASWRPLCGSSTSAGSPS